MNCIRKIINWFKKKWNVVKAGWNTGCWYILLWLLGSYLPCWFPCFTSFIEGKEDWWKSLLNVSNINVMAISLLSMTLYLWNKDKKFNKEDSRKDGDGFFLVYILVVFLIYGFLVYSNQSELKLCSRFNIISYVLFVVVLFFYLYYQLKDFAENNKEEKAQEINLSKSVHNDIDEMSKDLDKRLDDNMMKPSNDFDNLNNDINKRLE